MITETDVRVLSDGLSRFPGIHADRGQLCGAECAIRFQVDIARGGWRSLQVIAFVVSDDDSPWQLRVVSGDTPDDLTFELHGTGADPQAFADVLQQSINDLYDSN